MKLCSFTQDYKYLGWEKYPGSDDKLYSLPNYDQEVTVNCVYHLALNTINMNATHQHAVEILPDWGSMTWPEV